MRSVAGDDPESARTRTLASSVGEASSGRWTRSRGRLLAAENTGPAQSVEDTRGDRRRVEGFGVRKKRAAAGSERALSTEEVALAARPLPPPEPPFPKSGQHDDVVAWSEDLMKLGDEDSELLTLRAVRGTKSAKSAMSLDDRDMILDVACSVVNVSATEPDGNVVVYCTGIITEYDEVGKCAKILSSSSIMCSDEGKLRDPNQKVSVHLSNDTVVEARVLFFNDHYGVSFLDINTEFPLVPATLGSKPYYGQNVFVLDRDDEYALVVSRGSILYLEKPLFERNHYMFASYNSSLTCICGPVIDNNGEVIGLITSHLPQSAILSISIVKKCIQMWNKFGRIAHPIHHLELKTVRMLDTVYRDELRARHSIKSGFIVAEVCPDSTVEKIGLRRGDVIDLIDLDRRSTVVELEEFLLGLGWDFLEKKLDSHSTIDVKIRVHDIRAKTSVCTILPMGFSNAVVRSYH